jgi:hypothetical protein
VVAGLEFRMASKITVVSIIMTKSIQRNCPSPERLKAILGVLAAERVFGIAKRPTFRKMAKNRSRAN